jgi:hypothetical protein
VKFIRFFVTALATAAVLAILIVAAAFAPPVQTWFARMELLDQPGVQGSLGSVSASFGKLEVEDLRLQLGGIVLTLPSLQARMPIMKAVRSRQVLLKEFVAKGWTLDLSRLENQEVEVPARDSAADKDSTAAAAVQPEKQAALAFGGILTGRVLPFDGSLDGVDLDGDVILGVIPGKAPIRVHVIVTGGGMADGREGTFSIDATRVSEDSDSPVDSSAAHCRLLVSMDSPRTVDRVEIKAELAGEVGPKRVEVGVDASAAHARGAAEESYTLDLSRKDRHLATLTARVPLASRQLVGTWKVDLLDIDLAPFLPERTLPSLGASGSGRFDADTAFSRVHADGGLALAASGMSAVAPVFSRLGAVTVDVKFDATRTAQSISVNSVSASISGGRPAAAVKALQPFEIDGDSGGIKVGNPRADWLSVSIQGFPLNRLPAMPGGLTFSVGDANGEFLVRASDGGFAVRPIAPLTATGVSVERAGETIARDLDLSASMTADFGAKQWQFEWPSFTVAAGKRHLATVGAMGSRPVGPDQPLKVSGTGNVDLDALASIPSLSWITGRSASGDFTGSIGASSELECKLVVVGHDPTHTVSTTFNADEEATGAGELLAPVKVAFGTNVSDVSVEISWPAANAESRSQVKLSSDDVALEHLRLLAAPLAAAGGVALPSHSSEIGARWSPEKARDKIPFWGDWTARVDVAFEKLRTGDQDLTDVGGSFEIDHGSIQLEGGHGELPSKNMANISGSIVFDGGSEHPYVLSGSASGLSNVDSALLLPPKPGDDPVIQGHFTVAGSISGSGINLDDLIAGTNEEFQLAGTNGIIRLLRTNIADVIPEAKEPVSDSLGDVGNLVTSVLGIKGHSIDPGKNKVGRIPEAVIDFTNQVSEIGYDKIAVTAVRGSDRTIRLSNLEMTAADEHLSGSGLISYVKGLPISEEPLSVELHLGVRDVLTKLLATAGLLSADKDSLGFSLLRENIHFGGTLAHIDDSQWHDLLARAATQKPQPEKKSGAASAH